MPLPSRAISWAWRALAEFWSLFQDLKQYSKKGSITSLGLGMRWTHLANQRLPVTKLYSCYFQNLKKSVQWTSLKSEKRRLGLEKIPIKVWKPEGQSCPTLCDPVDYSPPSSLVHGILQARILEWLPFPSPGHLLDPGIEPKSPVSPALQAPSLPQSHQESPL